MLVCLLSIHLVAVHVVQGLSWVVTFEKGAVFLAGISSSPDIAFSHILYSMDVRLCFHIYVTHWTIFLHFPLHMAALHNTLTAEVQRLKLANTELMDEGRASNCTSQQGQMKHHIFQMQRQQPNQIQWLSVSVFTGKTTASASPTSA